TSLRRRAVSVAKARSSSSSNVMRVCGAPPGTAARASDGLGVARIMRAPERSSQDGETSQLQQIETFDPPGARPYNDRTSAGTPAVDPLIGGATRFRRG